MQNSHPNGPRRVAVCLYPDFSNHCLANAVEPLRAANRLSGRTLYEWSYVSIDGDEVLSSSGLPVRPEMRLADHPGGAMVMLIPSYGYRGFAGAQASRGLREVAKRFSCVVGMDCGAWLMAEAGLLDGFDATIHWDERTAFSETFPEINVVDKRFVVDGRMITCGGASTSFELVLDLIQKHHGSPLRLDVASLFMLGSHASGDLAPLHRTGIQRIDVAVAQMRKHIEDPISLLAIAKQAGMGQRRLEALFMSELGKTPRAVYKSIRLAEARRLLGQSRYSIAEIAGRCGYQDASAMSRAFRAEFGMRPSDIRHPA